MKNNFNAIIEEATEKYQDHLDDVEHNVLYNVSSLRSVTGFFGAFLERLSGMVVFWLGGKSK